MLIRVFEIPPPTGRFHFGGGEVQRFVEVDWFRDDEGASPGGQQQITDFIQAKRYYRDGQAYLVLHPLHSFTINYAAP